MAPKPSSAPTSDRSRNDPGFLRCWRHPLQLLVRRNSGFVTLQAFGGDGGGSGDGNGYGDGTECVYCLEVLTRERTGVLVGRPKGCCLLWPCSCDGGGGGGGGVMAVPNPSTVWQHPHVSERVRLPMAVVLRRL